MSAKAFEYMILGDHQRLDVDRLNDLNDLGADGWELVDIDAMSSRRFSFGSGEKRTYEKRLLVAWAVFKRELS